MTDVANIIFNIIEGYMMIFAVILLSVAVGMVVGFPGTFIIWGIASLLKYALLHPLHTTFTLFVIVLITVFAFFVGEEFKND